MSKKSNKGSNNEQRHFTGDHKNIQFRKKGIYSVVDGTRRRIAEPILVTAFATSDPGTAREQAFTEIKFLNRRNEWKKEIVSSSMLTTPAHEFICLLSKRGYIWPAISKERGHIIGALSVVKPARNIRVTSVPGWHGNSFALPGESYSPDGPGSKETPDHSQSHCGTRGVPAFGDTRRMEAICRETRLSFHPCSPRYCCQFRRSEFANARSEQFWL